MSDVTRILNATERGDPETADELLPLVYEQLRPLAAQKMSSELSGQTLQATALVHEAHVGETAKAIVLWFLSMRSISTPHYLSFIVRRR